jgi:hypothetical protein
LVIVRVSTGQVVDRYGIIAFFSAQKYILKALVSGYSLRLTEAIPWGIFAALEKGGKFKI